MGKAIKVVEWVTAIVKEMVDSPDDVSVSAIDGKEMTVVEVKVNPKDVGLVVGAKGQNVMALRRLLTAATRPTGRKHTLEIDEPARRERFAKQREQQATGK